MDCLNAPSEQWKRIRVSIAGGTYYLYQSNWTFSCMAVPNWPEDGTPVVQAPCDTNDVRQFWRERDSFIQSLQGALCVTAPFSERKVLGLRLEMRNCSGGVNIRQIWGFGSPTFPV